MTAFGTWTCFFIGVVIAFNSLTVLNHMSVKTNHLVRLAYFLMSVGGAALVVAPFARTEPWLTELGIVASLLGVCLLSIYGRRDNVREHP